MQREGAKPKSRPVEDEPQQEPMRGSIVGVRRNPSTDQKRVRRNMNKKASELDAFSVKRGVCKGEGCGVAMAMPDKSKQELCPNCLDRQKRDVAADQDKSFFDQTKASRKTASVDPNCVDCQKDAHNNGEHEDTPISNCLYCQNKAHLNLEHKDTPHYNCVRCQMKNADAHYDDNHYFTPDSNCWECQFDDHLLGQHDGTPEPNCRDCQENAHNSGHADINTTASRKTASLDPEDCVWCKRPGHDNGEHNKTPDPNCDMCQYKAHHHGEHEDTQDGNCYACQGDAHGNGEHDEEPNSKCDWCHLDTHDNGHSEINTTGSRKIAENEIPPLHHCPLCKTPSISNSNTETINFDGSRTHTCPTCKLQTQWRGPDRTLPWVSSPKRESSRKTAESENPLGPNRNRWGQWTDSKGNANAADGIDRCECGSKNWDNDRCNNCDKKWDITTTWNNRTLSSLLKNAGLAHYPADVNDAFDHLTKVHGEDPGEVLNEIYEHGYHTGINDGYPNGPSDDSPGDALKAHHSGLHSIIDGGYDEHFHHDEENPVLEVDHSLGGYDDGDQYNSEFKPQSSRKTATTYDVRADKLNPGDKVRDPYGGTSEVAQVRNHESGGSVYVDLKNGGTTVVDRGAQFSLVPADTRQRMIPGPGVPGGNTNANQDEAGVGNELPSSTICPVCGGQGTLHRVGDHYVCSRCGYTETAGGAGNQNYTTSPMTYQRRKTSSLLNVKENQYKQDWRSSSAIANRARAVSASEENQ